MQLIVDVYWIDNDRLRSRKAGAIDAVVAVMRAHADNAGVLEQACLTMKHVCCDNGAFVV